MQYGFLLLVGRRDLTYQDGFMDTGLEKIMTVEIINQRPDPEPSPQPTG